MTTAPTKTPKPTPKTSSTRTASSSCATIGIDVGNNITNIVTEADGSLTFSAQSSQDIWYTNDKARAFSDLANQYPGQIIAGTYPQKPHTASRNHRWFAEGLVVLQRRDDVPGLESSLALIEIGAGTIDMSLVNGAGEAVLLQTPFSDGGVVTLLDVIVASPEFQSSVGSAKKLTTGFTAIQLGTILAGLGSGLTKIDGNDLIFRGTITLKGFLKSYAPGIATQLGERVATCQRCLITMADRYGYSDFDQPFDADRIAIAGGGAELLKALAPTCDIASELRGKYLYSTGIPDGYLNAYCAYRAGGGAYRWPLD